MPAARRRSAHLACHAAADLISAVLVLVLVLMLLLLLVLVLVLVLVRAGRSCRGGAV